MLLFSRLAHPPQRVGEHHYRFVLILAVSGSGTVIVDETCFRLQARMAIMIFPYQFHNYMECDEELRWLFIMFETTHPEDMAPLRETPIPLNDRIIRWATEAAELYLSSAPHSPLQTAQLSAMVYIILQEMQQAAERAAASEHLPTGMGELFERIGRYVLRHLDEPIGVEDVARHVAYSPSHLRKIFREQYRIPLVQYIRKNRMVRACRLMETTELSISQITEKCGYNSLYSFSRAFKHDIGISPKAYRRLRKHHKLKEQN